MSTLVLSPMDIVMYSIYVITNNSGSGSCSVEKFMELPGGQESTQEGVHEKVSHMTNL